LQKYGSRHLLVFKVDFYSASDQYFRRRFLELST
jgi:hypothetical protein